MSAHGSSGFEAVLLLNLDRRKQELEDLCDALTSAPVGGAVTAPRPNPMDEEPQYGFRTATMWLSSWLTEAWRTSLDFLFDHANRVGKDDSEAREFIHIIGRLRTRFAHHLDRNDPKDRRTLEDCYLWYRKACGASLPRDDEQWRRCQIALLESAERYLSQAIDIAHAIDRHQDSEYLRELWKDRLSKTGAVLDYQGLLQRAAGDLGHDKPDLRALEHRHQRRLDKQLALLPSGSNKDDAIGRHMERVILEETVPLLPISAANVMERLQLPPGEAVATALRLAQVIWELSPADLNRANLLELLADAWQHLGTKGTAY